MLNNAKHNNILLFSKLQIFLAHYWRAAHSKIVFKCCMLARICVFMRDLDRNSKTKSKQKAMRDITTSCAQFLAKRMFYYVIISIIGTI